MSEQSPIDRRVGVLETRMAEVVTALGGLKSILDEVKVGLNNSRPSLWMLIPGIMGFVTMLVAGVVSVTSIKGDIGALVARADARTAQLTIMQSQIDITRERQWEELRGERDHLRKKADPL